MPELEIYIVIIVALTLTFAYAFGSRYNYKIQKKIWETLSKEIKPYSKKVSFRGLGSSGFKIVCKPSTGKLTKLEVTIVLMSRELPLYYFISKYKGKHDTIIIKSNFENTPKFSLEIVRKGTKFHRKLVKNVYYKELQHMKLSERFFLASTNPNKAFEFLSEKKVIQGIAKLGVELERLSIAMKEPHLLLSCSMREDVFGQLLTLASTCGKALEHIKGGM